MTDLDRASWCARLGEAIAQARDRAGMTQGQLADAVGVHRQSIYKWEAGTHPPDSYSLWRACKVLRVSVGALLR